MHVLNCAMSFSHAGVYLEGSKGGMANGKV